MFCGFGKKSDKKANQPVAPQPLMRRREEPEEQKSKAPDLRAESNEPDPEEPLLMEYLETKVITKGNDQCWVKRLFILTKT